MKTNRFIFLGAVLIALSLIWFITSASSELTDLVFGDKIMRGDTGTAEVKEQIGIILDVLNSAVGIGGLIVGIIGLRKGRN